MQVPLYAPMLTIADMPLLSVNRPGYTASTTGGAHKPRKTYKPNGKREVARRLRQAERIAAKRVAA